MSSPAVHFGENNGNPVAAELLFEGTDPLICEDAVPGTSAAKGSGVGLSLYDKFCITKIEVSSGDAVTLHGYASTEGFYGTFDTFYATITVGSTEHPVTLTATHGTGAGDTTLYEATVAGIHSAITGNNNKANIRWNAPDCSLA